MRKDAKPHKLIWYQWSIGITFVFYTIQYTSKSNNEVFDKKDSALYSFLVCYCLLEIILFVRIDRVNNKIRKSAINVGLGFERDQGMSHPVFAQEILYHCILKEILFV